nr:MAG TPA: adenine-specific methyltransferase [Caudoviricetes sp.]
MITQKLILGDCLEKMKNIPDHSVDLVLCDLPYQTTSCSWDKMIPFDPLWEQYIRIIKNNGVIALFGSQPFSSHLVLSNEKMFVEELVWLKNKPASGMQKDTKHLKIHENIYIFSKCAKHTYNPQKWLVEDKEFLTQRKTFKENEYIGNNIYGPTTRTRKRDDGSRYPISLLSCKTPFTSSITKKYNANIEIRLHPTQKPIKLLEYLIKTYTNENETVLDNCFGSNSTGVACVNTNRNYIGIEKDEKYFQIGVGRVQKFVKENSIDCKVIVE